MTIIDRNELKLIFLFYFYFKRRKYSYDGSIWILSGEAKIAADLQSL